MNMKQQLDLENYILDTTTTSEILISAHPARKFHRTPIKLVSCIQYNTSQLQYRHPLFAIEEVQ